MAGKITDQGRFTYHGGKIYDRGTEISLAEFNQFIVNGAKVLQEDQDLINTRDEWMNFSIVPGERSNRKNNQQIYRDLLDADKVHRRIYPDLYPIRGTPVERKPPAMPIGVDKISQAIGVEAEPDAGTAFAEAVEEKDEEQA